MSQARQKLDRFIKKHFKEIPIEKADVVTGSAYEQIIQYVEGENIDLISGSDSAGGGGTAPMPSRARLPQPVGTTNS